MVNERSNKPAFLSLQQFAVGSDFKFKTKLGVEDVLKFFEYCFHFGAQLGNFAFKFVVLILKFTLSLFFLAPQVVKFPLQLLVLQTKILAEY